MYDKNKVLAFYKTNEPRLCRGREAVLRNCYENMLFWLDHQWIRWDGAERTFFYANPARGTPRPVENVYRPKLLKSVAMLNGIEPSLTFAPGSEQEDDRITADNARLVLKYLEEIVNMERVRLRLSYNVPIFGNAFTVAGFDPDGGDLVSTDGNGMPIYDGIPTLDVATPFEILCDYTIPDMERQPVVIWRKMRTIQWKREHYPGSKFTNDSDADNVAATSDLGLTYLQNIIRLQPNLSGIIGSGAQYSKACVVDDVYALPCHEFPKGLWARIVNNGEEVLEAKELPFHTGTDEKPGRKFIPVTHYGFEEVPGALLCTTPANSMKEPQRQRNRLIAHILLYFARMANGVWAIPDNADISTMSGTEGVVIRFTANSAGGGEPKRIEGARLPNSFAERLTQIDAVMDEMVAMQDLSGEFPRMDSAAMLNTLIEQQQQRLGPVFKRWGASWKMCATQLFHVFRNFAPEEIYYKIKGEEARWSVMKIRTADLQGGVDIKIEPQSLVPKTLLQKRAGYEQAAQLMPDLLQDPNVRLKYARALGVSELMEGLNEDDQQISREHDALKAWAKQFFDMETGELLEGVDPMDPNLQMPVHVDPDCDLHPLHFERHRRWMLSEEFQALPPSVQDMFRVYHLRVHMQIMQMQLENGAGAEGENGDQNGEQQPGQNKKSKGGGGGYEGRSNKQRMKEAA